MDFAELNDLAIFRFTDVHQRERIKEDFAHDIKNRIKSAEYEYNNSGSSLGRTLLKVLPIIDTIPE